MDVPVSTQPCRNGLEGQLWGVKAELEFRRLLADVMKRSGMSRAAIAQEMSRLLGRTVTKQTLDDFVRSRRIGRASRFPAAWVPTLCQVIRSDELQRHLLSEELLEWLSIGESIAHSPAPLKRAYEGVLRLVRLGRRRAGRSKR